MPGNLWLAHNVGPPNAEMGEMKFANAKKKVAKKTAEARATGS